MSAPHQARITLSPVDFVDDVDERSIGLTTALPIIKIGRSSKSQAKNFVPGRDNAWIDSAVMSRDHAMIRWSESLVNPLFIEDMGSMHGTYLNGRKVHSGEPHALNDGDLVTFGFEVTRASETFPARSFRVHFESKASTHQPTPPTSSYSVPEASEDESDSREPEAVDSSLKRQSADERATTKSSVSNCAVRGDASDSEDEPRVFTVPDSENSSSAGSLFEEGEDELTHHHFDQLPTLARKVTTRSEVADVDDIPASQPSDAAALETDDDERYGVMPALIDIPSSPPSSAELKQPYGPCSWGSHQKPMKIEDSEEEQPEECPTRTVIEVAVPDTIHKSWSRGINRQPEIHEQGSEPDHSDGGRSYQYTDLDDDDDEEADGDGQSAEAEEQPSKLDVMTEAMGPFVKAGSSVHGNPAPRVDVMVEDSQPPAGLPFDTQHEHRCAYQPESSAPANVNSSTLERPPSPSDAAMPKPSIATKSPQSVSELHWRISQTNDEIQRRIDHFERNVRPDLTLREPMGAGVRVSGPSPDHFKRRFSALDAQDFANDPSAARSTGTAWGQHRGTTFSGYGMRSLWCSGPASGLGPTTPWRQGGTSWRQGLQTAHLPAQGPTARGRSGKVAISDILEPDMPCPAPVASAKRKAEALDDHTKISFAPVRPEHISAPPSPGYALDLPDAQPVDALAPESQGTSLDILEKPQHEESEASPTRKRVKTEDSRAEYNRVKGAAKVLGGAVVAGVGMFLALAAACPDQIV